MSNTYNLFISHSWAYGDAYDKLIKLLDIRDYFTSKDFSVPKHDPILLIYLLNKRKHPINDTFQSSVKVREVQRSSVNFAINQKSLRFV